MSQAAGRLHTAEVTATVLAFLGGGAALAAAFGASSIWLVALVAAIVYPLARHLRLRSSTLLEAAFTALGGYLGYRLGLFSREPAAGLAMFLLVAQATKLIAPRVPRDTSLARVIGIVLAGVAAAEGVELHFGVALAACVVLLLLSGVLSTVNQQIRTVRESGPDPSSLPALAGKPGRLRVGLAHAGVLITLALLSSATFLVIPRMGAKLLPRRSASTERLSGFSDVVGLEDIGRIKQSNSVALRVELSADSPRPPAGEIYWRGAALDQYDGSSWKATELLSWGLRLESLDPLSMRDPMADTDRGPLGEATFYLEPIGTKYLFTLGTVESVHFKNARPRRLRRNAHGGYTVARPSAVSLAYRIRYQEDDAPQFLLNPTLANHVVRTCLMLPPQVDQGRMRSFTQRVLQQRGLANAQMDPDRLASVLESYLHSEFRYTTESTRDPDLEPVEEFLFVKRAGHCEFFASALAILLRCEGVPSRVVTGFRGGELNAWTGTYTVRQREAHAWTEALIDGRWRRFDATPADPVVAGPGGLLGAVEQLNDWVELKWFQYVIAFDAYDQQNALFLLRERLAPFTNWLREAFGQRSGRVLGALGALLLAVLLCGGAARVLRRRPWRGGLVLASGASEASSANRLALGRLLAALGRRNLIRRPNETPLELARRAQRQLDLPAEALTAWIPRYYADRYGGRALDSSQLAELERLVEHLDGLEWERTG